MAFSSVQLKEKALQLGFNLIGITPAQPAATLEAYFRWVDVGMHGAMGYMARPDRQIRRRDLSVILPDARSLVVVGLDYLATARATWGESVFSDPSRGRIASYAWGLDYHDIMAPRLEALAEWLQTEAGDAIRHRVYVDTGAILERAHAHEAGLGFVGKNTMLIHPQRGSAFFLGEIITDLAFDVYDVPGRETMCGSCTRCLVACPTSAFPRPHVLDARRCISYLTIENKGWIEPELRPLMGNWVFGCDVCQDVCPWQRFTSDVVESRFYTDELDRVAPRLLDLLALDDAGFKAAFAGSPIARIGRARMVRNACIAAGNWGSDESVPLLTSLVEDESPLVRGHAAWALSRIRGTKIGRLLEQRLHYEPDETVQTELTRLLDNV